MKVQVEQVVSGKRVATFFERWAVWMYMGALVSFYALQVALGALPTRVYAHDLFIFLDGAWRVACGQTPSVDFYAGYGVLVWNPLRWGLALHDYNADGIGLARALYTAFIGIWFVLLNSLKPRRVESMLLGFFLLMFVSAARPLGEYPTWVSHAMFYNRIGYALLFLIVFEQLGVSRFEEADQSVAEPQQGKAQFWLGLSTGMALACTLLVKVVFLLPGLALLATGLLLFGTNRKHVAGLLCGSLGMLVLAITCLHFRPLPFLRETLTLVRQRGHIVDDAVTMVVQDFGGVVFTLAAGIAIARVGFRNRPVEQKYLVATVVIAGCDIFCRAANAIRADLPLAAFWSLGGAVLLLSFPRLATAATARRPRMIALLVICPLVVPIFLMDLSSSVYAAYKTLAIRNHASLRFDSPRLRNWVPQDWLGEDPNYVTRNGKPLILATNDGIHLLQRLSRPDETVSCIAYDNPFSFALGRRPAEGGAVWLYMGNNLSVAHPLPELTAIGHPDLLMVERPNFVEGNTTNAILALYPDLLTKEFALVGSSEYWTLYRRRI